MKNTTFKTLVRSAFRFNEYQLEGGPRWAETVRFNVLAKLPAGAAMPQIPEMLHAMLADRFQLTFHRITKTLPEYQLSAVRAHVMDKNGDRREIRYRVEVHSGAGHAAENDTLPTIFAALQETLGLKLESTKRPVDVLVIDRAEGPSEH
jgi:hypothetical protein